jgi:hypothetical protein
VKKALAWMMTLGAAAGIGATQMRLIGEGEPLVVLQLSWAALLFAGLDGLLIASKED